jgi:hypothetical protein
MGSRFVESYVFSLVGTCTFEQDSFSPIFWRASRLGCARKDIKKYSVYRSTIPARASLASAGPSAIYTSTAKQGKTAVSRMTALLAAFLMPWIACPGPCQEHTDTDEQEVSGSSTIRGGSWIPDRCSHRYFSLLLLLCCCCSFCVDLWLVVVLFLPSTCCVLLLLFGAGGKIENEKESGDRVLSVERGINVSCPRHFVRFRLNTLMGPVSHFRDVCGRANVHGWVRTLYWPRVLL